MVGRQGTPPLVALALASALGFYTLSIDSLRPFGLLLLPLLAVLCFSCAHALWLLPLLWRRRRPLALRRAVLRLSLAALAALVAPAAALVSRPSFEAGQDPHRMVALEGRLDSDPRSLDGSLVMARLRGVKALSADMTQTTVRGSITVFLESDQDYQYVPFLDFPRGTRVLLKGRYTEGERGPLFLASSFRVLEQSGGLEAFRSRLRRRLISTMKTRPWGGMTLALLLGWRDGLDASQELAFRQAGASHVLALSGMHMAVISALLLLAFKRPLGLVASNLVSIAVLLVYLWLAGPQSSLVRAFIMYALASLCAMMGLPAKGAVVISASFLIQLVLEPHAATTPAFVLSYLALAGILLLSKPLFELLPALLPPFLRSPLAASLAAFLAAIPAQALFFAECRPVGILASIPLAPLAGLCMVLGIAWLALHALWPPFAVPVDLILCLVQRLMDRTSHLAARSQGIALSWPPAGFIFTAAAISGILLLYRYSCTRRCAPRSQCVPRRQALDHP